MLSGWEWIVILGVAAIVIMWGPAKIPELAKSLGRAKGEFDKASKEYNKAAFETSTTTSEAATVAAAPKSDDESDETLFALAKKYGVSTEGKTNAKITAEMLEKIKEPQSS